MLPTYGRVDKSDPVPRHHQVRRILMDMVTSGAWKPGEKIPAETDLAESLGVSKMTVNKAILALTSERVFFREVGRGTFVSGNGFEPLAVVESNAGDADRTGKTIQIITLSPPEWISNDEYHCALVLALRCYVSPLHFTLRLLQARGQEYVQRYRESKADGWFMIAPQQDSLAGLRALNEIRARAVLVGASWSNVGFPCVDSDNMQGTRMAIDHLVELGHRKIAMLYAEPTSSNTLDRLRTFRESMRTHGLAVREDWILAAESYSCLSDSMRQQIRIWMGQETRPTAIFAAGAFIARELLDYVQSLGVNVPAELSIVSYDDPTAVAHASPTLTTILQPLEEMAQMGAAFLTDMIENPDSVHPQKTVLPCRLLVRGSTAPPR